MAIVKRTVVTTDDFEVHDCVCDGLPHSGWSAPRSSSTFGLVFTREGSFRRRIHGQDNLIDSTVAYFQHPGQQQQFAHAYGVRDHCTALIFTEEFVTSVWGAPDVPLTPLHIEPRINLQLALVLKAGSSGSIDEVGLMDLVAAVLECGAASRVTSTRPGTHIARRRIVDEARAYLSKDRDVGLAELAGRLAVSPHHLSRIFVEQTGQTFARYRIKLRIAAALRLLEEGESDLATVATDAGFSDHAHLARTFRREFDHTPSTLRALLREPSGVDAVKRAHG